MGRVRTMAAASTPRNSAPAIRVVIQTVSRRVSRQWLVAPTSPASIQRPEQPQCGQSCIEEPFQPRDRLLEASPEFACISESLDRPLGGHKCVTRAAAFFEARRHVGREFLSHTVFPRLDGPNRPHRASM